MSNFEGGVVVAWGLVVLVSVISIELELWKIKREYSNKLNSIYEEIVKARSENREAISTELYEIRKTLRKIEIDVARTSGQSGGH